VTRLDWATATSLFNAVESSFREILVLYGALSPEQSAMIAVAIEAIQTSIDAIRSGFSLAKVEGGESWPI
jgi:hypothetical protein